MHQKAVYTYPFPLVMVAESVKFARLWSLGQDA